MYLYVYIYTHIYTITNVRKTDECINLYIIINQKEDFCIDVTKQIIKIELVSQTLYSNKKMIGKIISP